MDRQRGEKVNWALLASCWSPTQPADRFCASFQTFLIAYLHTQGQKKKKDICTHTISSPHTQVMVRRKSKEIFSDSSLPPGSLLTALIWVLWWQRYSQGLICTSKSHVFVCLCVCVCTYRHKMGHHTGWLNMCVYGVSAVSGFKLWHFCVQYLHVIMGWVEKVINAYRFLHFTFRTDLDLLSFLLTKLYEDSGDHVLI